MTPAAPQIQKAAPSTRVIPPPVSPAHDGSPAKSQPSGTRSVLRRAIGQPACPVSGAGEDGGWRSRAVRHAMTTTVVPVRKGAGAPPAVDHADTVPTVVGISGCRV